MNLYKNLTHMSQVFLLTNFSFYDIFFWKGMIYLKEEFYKYKNLLLYLLFGGFTTIINIFVYSFCTYKCQISNTKSTIIAWFVSVSFAFITNKLFVFEKKSWNYTAIKEYISFFSFRFLSGVLDVIFMYITVDLLNFHSVFMKIVSNIFVITLNYIFSKFIIFKEGNNE